MDIADVSLSSPCSHCFTRRTFSQPAPLPKHLTQPSMAMVAGMSATGSAHR